MARWLVFALIVHGCARAPAPAARARAGSPASAAPVDPFSEVALRKTVAWLCDPARRGRGFDSPEAEETARWLEQRFIGYGFEVVRQSIGAAGGNVLAVKRGSRRANQAVLVSAHYDHLGVGPGGEIYWGADDNASGIAVLLALAEFARARSFERTIVFAAFGGEEKGLVGSGAYVADPLWPIGDTVAVINFDMVGRRFFERGGARPDTLGVVGLEQDEGVRDATVAAAGEVGVALVRASAHFVELFGFDDRTDEWWFRRRGILAVHFSTGMHPDYHQPTDTEDKLVYSQIRKTAMVAAKTMKYLADAPRIRSRREDSAAERRP